jgi:hypothetical protein
MDLLKEVKAVLKANGLSNDKGGEFIVQPNGKFVEVLWHDPQASKSTQHHELQNVVEVLEDDYNIWDTWQSVMVYSRLKHASQTQPIPPEDPWWKTQ